MKPYIELIHEIISDSGKDIDESDLKDIQEEFISFIDSFIESSPKLICETIQEKERHHSLFRKDNEEEPRIVIIGDIHCDFNALKGILQKLSISTYDYFDKAYFVFLGDYIDRGALPFQTLRLIFKFKQLLGERCILLRGNHDAFFYDEEKDTYYSNVSPAETIDLFNEYFDKKTISKFKDFFNFLPFYVTIKRNSKKYLLVHGGIPKDVYIEKFPLSDIAEARLPLSGKEESHAQLYRVLYSLLWGDPSDAKFKNNTTTTRFEFGSEQFGKFKEVMGFTHLVRGHEPKPAGFEPKYDNQLFTVFSSGGTGNDSSYYSEDVPNPSFAIIDEEGNLRPEAILTHRMLINIADKLRSSLFENAFKTIKLDEKEPYQLEVIVPLEFINELNDKKEQSDRFLHEEFFISMSFSAIPQFIKEKFSFFLKQ